MRHTCAFFAAFLLFGCDARPAQSPASLPSGSGNRSLAADSVVGGGTNYNFSADQSVQVYATAESAPRSRGIAAALGFSGSGSGGSSGATTQLPSGGEAAPERGEMIDIEARFAIQCDAVNACATKFRELVGKSEGRITVDEANAGAKTEVTFEVRVPASRFETFAGGLTGIGDVQARDVRRKDVSKEFHDSELLLHERDAARQRYEDLLKEAKTVEDTLKIEQQLERLRTEIDRIKGDMVWLKDRVADATVRVRIFPSATSEDAVFAPTATLYPTLRTSMMFDLRSETQRAGYFGGGFSVQFKPFLRDITFDVDIARAALADKPVSSDWSYTFLTGFDLYSELLGGGRRKFINPYIGFRLGYAITEGLGDFAFGGTIGVDIVKTKAVLLDLHARILGLAGNDQGPHVMLGPAIDFSFAF
jgi:hypothetical protein